jgi:hypothetical protein
MAMIRVLLLAAVAVACSREAEPPAAVAPARPAPEAKVARPRPASLTQVTIKALGMYCEESCPVKVRYALADLPQVYELGFDVSTESIFISYDATLGPAKQVTRPMIAAIKSAGFDPWLAKEAWPDVASVQVVTR